MDIRVYGVFKKDLKRCIKQGKSKEEIQSVIDILAIPKELDRKYKPHNLEGNFRGWKECHISNDWLLIYRYRDNFLELFRTGTHSELFGK